MRPAAVAAGFQFCRPGSVSRAAKSVTSAKARRDTESAMPLDVSNFTKSRREVFTSVPLAARVGFAFYCAGATLSGLLLKGKYFRREPRTVRSCRRALRECHVMYITKDAISRGDRRYTGCATGALNYGLRGQRYFPHL